MITKHSLIHSKIIINIKNFIIWVFDAVGVTKYLTVLQFYLPKFWYIGNNQVAQKTHLTGKSNLKCPFLPLD